MKAKYTPWTIVERNNDKMIPMVNIEGITSGGHPIVISQVWERSQARLIATVPELVEALQELIDAKQDLYDMASNLNGLGQASPSRPFVALSKAIAALALAGVE